MYTKTGKEVIEAAKKGLPDINLSRRFEFRLAEQINRIINERNGLENKISKVLQGFEVFNPETSKVIAKSKRDL
ncbi:hypothetical protein [Croceimicrobium sp.]|uniref:hypothetical protein n=1 Tax=Croceimicrobium sp. TaxID=2828340 RepID=UPI003BAB6D95